MNDVATNILDVSDLCVDYASTTSFGVTGAPSVRAVKGISLTLQRGETLSLVGESGCGKSTTAMAILQLTPPSGGRVVFDGRDITGFSHRQMRPLRREMQIIYQDPFGSLNPRMTIADLIAEPMAIQGVGRSGHERRAKAAELLDTVGMGTRFLDRYPHQLSGGQRQRVAIARALSLRPKLLICDEPVSALDVSVQAQVLNLFSDLKEQFGLSYLFISHDLGVVRHMSDRVAVMYLGRIVEIATRDDLYGEPLHPYTRILLDAVAVPDPQIERARDHVLLQGEVPSVATPPPGCPFHPRCQSAMPVCSREIPPLRLHGNRQIACHLYDETAANKAIEAAMDGNGNPN